MAECHCEECDPGQHRECSVDCHVWDCGSSWACCNDQCDAVN